MGRQLNTFGRGERLKSVIVFDRAFSEGSKLKAFPILVRYTHSSFDAEVPYQVATTVSKRKFKRAVDRNRIKRLMREAWRLEKHRLLQYWTPGDPQRAIVFIYVGKQIPTFEQCKDNIRKIVNVLIDSPIEKQAK
ncbi:MAG: ribonuclease P protein component [Bacteroidetes bacterium]|nr:MAG: ribonuclease P protein component [Bacteroidota bacterium]